MSQFNWTVIAQNGKKFNIGLYHGDQSGHLLVHCNQSIILIDFQVLDTKTYTFFIEDELCELTIERKSNNKFLYGLVINREADTPLNRLRKKLDRKYLIQGGLFAAGFAVFILALTLGLRHYQNSNRQLAFDREDFENYPSTEAIIHMDSVDRLFEYFYIVNGKEYHERATFQDFEQHREAVLPVFSGDRFTVFYHIADPAIHVLRLDRPTDSHLEIMVQRVIQKHAQLHPEWSSERIKCQVELAYQLKGLPSLGDFFYQTANPDSNFSFNQNTYWRLTRDEPFRKQSAEKCWE